MINFSELKELSSIATNTSANGMAFREITTKQVIEALIGDAIERTSGLEIDDKSGIGRIAGKKLANTFLNHDGSHTFYEFLEFKVNEQAQRVRIASESGDQLQLNTRTQACVNYCYGLQTLMSSISRNAYYRKLQAERMEEPGADRATSRPNDYDGFQNVSFTADQVVDAVEDIYGTFKDLEDGVDSLQGYYTAFNLISGGKAISSHLVAGRDYDGASGQWIDHVDVADVWERLERQRLERVATLPSREDAVAAM